MNGWIVIGACIGALAAAIVVIRRAVHAAAILKTIDIDHPLCESTGISPAVSSYAGMRDGDTTAA